MKMKHSPRVSPFITRCILLLAGTVWVSMVCAQSHKAIESEIAVRGTSNVRNWKMVSNRATATAKLEFKDNILTGISSLQFSLAVSDLKGDAALMNKRAYKALRAYPHDRISYTAKFSKISELEGRKYLVKTEGNLSIAGKTRIVSIPLSLGVNSDGTVTCRGSKNVLMSEFGVELPEVLVKNMEIGDEVIVDFDLLLEPSLQR